MPSEEDQPKAGDLRRDRTSRTSSQSGDSLPSLASPSPTIENLPGASDSPTQEELPSNFRKKERKIHKDSVCAFVFRKDHPKKPFPQLV
ncbi:unnamed protein product, partial [Mesorhabditis belari]|uniref:Uncharacterized protein n=1 Tax=Mesorhabditis belari TaxID=2138241 RepID=A0AAF3EIG4_9BILA